MSDEPEKVSLEFLGEQMKRLLSGQAEIKNDLSAVKKDVVDLKSTARRIDGNIEELSVAVAALSLNNQHIRADVAKVLANQGDYEQRLARIEKHLGLPPLN